MSAPTTRPPDRSANPPYGDLVEANAAQSAAKAGGQGQSSQPKKVAPQQLTGAQSVIRSLEELDVEIIFGIPGGAVLPVYDPLFDSVKLRHVLVRHEQGAGHAASGYAHATGKVGVCMATSGPGATNLVTPLADAQMDSIPVVAITGQVGRGLIGTDAFQEADISGITMPITKHNFLVRDGDDIPRVMAEAFHIARSGRPGAGAGRHPQGRAAGAVHVQLAAEVRPARLQAEHQAAQPADPRGRQADRGGAQAGALRRRRRHPRRGDRGTAGSRRADRHPGRHHADGARRVPGQPSAEPWHAGHARHGRRGGGAAAQRSADRARHAVRRPGDGQAGFVRAGGQGHPRRHRPGGDRQEPPRRRADRRRRQGRHHRPDRGAAPRRNHRHRDGQVVGVPARRAVDVPAELRAAERRQPVARST